MKLEPIIKTDALLAANAKFVSQTFSSRLFEKLVGFAVADKDGRLEIQQGSSDNVEDVISEFDLSIADVAVDKAFSYNANTAAYTDETADANNDTADDVALPPIQATTSGDAIYFGSYVRANVVSVNVSTAGVYSDITIAWEYWNGTAWTAVSGLSDGTSGFTVAGTSIVSFSMPSDIAQTSVNGVTMYWVRAVATLGAAPAITTAPLAAQAWNRPLVEIPFSIDTIAPYARAVYYNDAAAQTYFRLALAGRR